MAKSIKIKCTSSRAVNIQENNLYSARIDDEGNVSMMVYNSAELKKRVYLSVGISGELFIAGVGGVVVATFIELKTKTLKCVGLDHKNPVKKSFTVGKRYQVESGRALGGVAGYIFDRDGCRWTLYREEVGFSVSDGTTFEAKYL
ncbi:hypothetical protein H1O00_gp46 [Klebsiella phage vB_KpnS_IMGroot]|uniref:Uncharacterized protein n=2 Tax=Webervirus TaxID=1920860 RepID=A0A5B9NCZ5_9CAUD|nr:hypothetical protein H1O00_gp46 [Klebsiella phage vB_KpnS_IMGroot]QEG12027.1 hypothetical protein GROOT_46 [Klebsiella phage vB_KpnS_IMGroot]QEG13434.1 hypothetical protein PENG_47 [Klebsiella phage vB_KpnS_Penguinator]QPX75305.1 hypothetical protein [Klebsiella phage vB_KpnS_IMGroot]